MSVPEPACPPFPTSNELTAVPSKYVEIPVIIGENTFIRRETVILAVARGPPGRLYYQPVHCVTIEGETDTELRLRFNNTSDRRVVLSPKELYANSPNHKFYRLSDKPKAYQLAKESNMMNIFRQKNTAQTTALGQKGIRDIIDSYLMGGRKKSRRYKTRRYKRSRLSRRKKHH
jgi:hypothetical protein